MAFDLDDEELKATRILNGADKKMNIEEAIERMHDLIHTCNAGIEKYGIYDDLFQKDKEAIETVLNMLKEKDREIEKLKKHNKELLRKLRNRVKEVKELNKYSLYKKEFKTLNEQLKNKDQIIDLMAGFIFQNIDVEEDICDSAYVECKQELANDITCIKCIKQYFKSKAEKE